MGLRWGLVVLGLSLAAVGAVGAQGTYSPVTEANVVDLKLNHYYTPDKKQRDRDFEWTFTKTGFVLKKGTGAIPADLLEKLLPKGMTADEVKGSWKLEDDDAKRLVLTDIEAGGKPGNKAVTLTIYKTAPTVVRIGEPQYVFGIGR